MINIILAVIGGCIGGLVLADIVDAIEEHFNGELNYIEDEEFN